jgi:hypothetical protein
MKRSVVLAGLLALGFGSGCEEETNNIVIRDLSVRVGQDANMGVPIGGQCELATDCKTGSNPTCRKKRMTKTGMCTADCNTDADCGVGNVCLFEPDPNDPNSTPGACAKICETETDCTEGLGCWISLDKVACWPVDGIAEYGKSLTLNCDPTVAGCTFAGQGLPGGCSRQILGPGNAGACRQSCVLGVGTCPDIVVGSERFQQSCYHVDESIDADGMPTGDKLKMPLCVGVVPVGTPPAFIPDGTECLDPVTMTNHYYNICFPGSQCETYTTVSGGTEDNKCHQLCYLGNFSPPDGGTLFTDGGLAMGCTTGTCTDVFGTAGIASPGMPIGLCK